MGQRLHSSARTTEAVGRAIQQSKKRLLALGQRDGIHPKPVATWKQHTCSMSVVVSMEFCTGSAKSGLFGPMVKLSG